jgi:hypothetical protein
MAFCAAIIVTICSVVEPAAVFAQGGKAEPVLIRFQRGRDSATVNATLRRRRPVKCAVDSSRRCGSRFRRHVRRAFLAKEVAHRPG